MRTSLGTLGALGVMFSMLLSILIFAAGLTEILLGAKALIVEAVHEGWNTGPVPRNALSSVLNGLELLFLAPMIALTFASSILFLKAKFDRLIDIIGRKNERERQAIQVHESDVVEEMHKVKLSVTGLMVSVLLTDLIGRIITDAPLGMLRTLGSTIATILCIGYYLALDRGHLRMASAPEEGVRIAAASVGSSDVLH